MIWDVVHIILLITFALIETAVWAILAMVVYRMLRDLIRRIRRK